MPASKPASRCACRRSCASRRRRGRLTPPLGLSKGDRDLIERDDPVRGRTRPGPEQAYGIAVQGGTGTKRHIDGLLAGMADRFGERPRLGAPAGPRHHRRAAGGQEPRCGRQARPHLPDALGGQDLLGAGEGRAEAAAGQGRGGARQGRGPRRRGPRAQGAAGRAGQGHACHHALLGDRPRGAQGVVGVAEARHRSPAPVARAHGTDRPTRSSATTSTRAQVLADSGIEAKLHLHARRLVIPHPSNRDKIDVTAPLPDHMRKAWESIGGFRCGGGSMQMGSRVFRKVSKLFLCRRRAGARRRRHGNQALPRPRIPVSWARPGSRPRASLASGAG